MWREEEEAKKRSRRGNEKQMVSRREKPAPGAAARNERTDQTHTWRGPRGRRCCTGKQPPTRARQSCEGSGECVAQPRLDRWPIAQQPNLVCSCCKERRLSSSRADSPHVASVDHVLCCSRRTATGGENQLAASTQRWDLWTPDNEEMIHPPSRYGESDASLASTHPCFRKMPP